jgi:hypothetical protein
VPRFAVDPYWPKPLPNNWEMGELGAVFVDTKDHVWVISRPRTLTPDQIGLSLTPPTSECCIPAPPVIEFDQEGRVVQSWGGPGAGYEWPANEHGIFVDHKGNVWLGGNTANQDSQILKFTHDGKLLLQIGHAKTSKGSLDTDNLNRPAQIWVWEPTNEVFVADGYQNRRVIVFDADTGKFKRMWGAYGNKPDDAVSRDRVSTGPRGSEQFNIVHGVSISRDGLVYVSDRVNNRIQVFTLDGKFIKEGFIARGTLDSRGTRSPWRSRPTGISGSSSCPTRQRQGPQPSIDRPSGARLVGTAGAVRGPVALAAQPRARPRRATSIRGVARQPPAEIREPEALTRCLLHGDFMKQSALVLFACLGRRRPSRQTSGPAFDVAFDQAEPGGSAQGRHHAQRAVHGSRGGRRRSDGDRLRHPDSSATLPNHRRTRVDRLGSLRHPEPVDCRIAAPEQVGLLIRSLSGRAVQARRAQGRPGTRRSICSRWREATASSARR